jgi:ribosomal protein L12E/L44/L45/RPP1/RPP2
MKVGRRTVNWRQPFWISFAAFLTSLRHSGSRKADLLDVVASDFCLSSMTRRNLKWYINGRLMDIVTPAMLAAMTRADCAVIIPGRTKADPFSLFFGDKPIYLPFEPNDITNAAMWLRTMELDRPVLPEERSLVPLFASDDVSVPLTHYEADAVFNSMAKDLLGDDAKSLSLHSGRVWLACALLASGHDTAQIQAMVRWLSPEAVKIYAHTNPEDYVRNLRRAMGAPITSRLATNVAEMELDGDRAVQAVRSAVGGFAAATPAVPRAGAARPRSSSAPPPSSELSDGDDSAEEHDDDEEDDDDDPSVLCDAGPVVADTALTPGAEVAVPLKLKGREVHYVATLGGRKQNGNYLVRFPDGLTMEARRDSLFKVIPFDEQI